MKKRVDEILKECMVILNLLVLATELVKGKTKLIEK